MASLSPTVVFDLDGTLADTAGDLVSTLNVILAREGLAPLPLEQASTMIGAGARALLERGFAASGRHLAPARLDTLYSAFLDHYGEHLCVATTLYPGVKKALLRLEGAGFRLAICTNKVEAHAVNLLKKLRVGHRFAAISGRDTFRYCKPDPRHLTLTIERAGGRADRAVMVGDSKTDIATARAAGIPVVAVPFGYTDAPVETLGPDRIVTHFDDLFDAVRDLTARAAAA